MARSFTHKPGSFITKMLTGAQKERLTGAYKRLTGVPKQKNVKLKGLSGLSLSKQM